MFSSNHYQSFAFTFKQIVTPEPTSEPSRQPTSNPTDQPSSQPSSSPSISPTHAPTSQPTNQPTNTPSSSPSKSPSSSPSLSCGNGICSIEEDPGTCPIDCIAKYVNTQSPNAEASGVMFTIEATDTSDVTIGAFNVLGKKDGDSQVTVYTRSGPHNGHETNGNAWNKLVDTEVRMDKDIPAFVRLSREIRIPAGSSQAFYIYSEKGMRYSKNKSGEGIQSVDDGSINIIQVLSASSLLEATDAA